MTSWGDLSVDEVRALVVGFPAPFLVVARDGTILAASEEAASFLADGASCAFEGESIARFFPALQRSGGDTHAAHGAITAPNGRVAQEVTRRRYGDRELIAWRGGDAAHGALETEESTHGRHFAKRHPRLHHAKGTRIHAEEQCIGAELRVARQVRLEGHPRVFEGVVDTGHRGREGELR